MTFLFAAHQSSSAESAERVFDSFGNIDMKLLFHRLFAVTQLRRVLAARHESLRIIAAVFDENIFRRPQIPVQFASNPGAPARLQVCHWLPGCICDRDFDFVAGEFFYPNREDRAFRRILAAVNRLYRSTPPTRQQIGTVHRRDR